MDFFRVLLASHHPLNSPLHRLRLSFSYPLNAPGSYFVPFSRRRGYGTCRSTIVFQERCLLFPLFLFLKTTRLPCPFLRTALLFSAIAVEFVSPLRISRQSPLFLTPQRFLFHDPPGAPPFSPFRTHPYKNTPTPPNADLSFFCFF